MTSLAQVLSGDGLIATRTFWPFIVIRSPIAYVYSLNWHRSFDICKLVDARRRARSERVFIVSAKSSKYMYLIYSQHRYKTTKTDTVICDATRPKLLTRSPGPIIPYLLPIEPLSGGEGESLPLWNTHDRCVSRFWFRWLLLHRRKNVFFRFLFLTLSTF